MALVGRVVDWGGLTEEVNSLVTSLRSSEINSVANMQHAFPMLTVDVSLESASAKSLEVYFIMPVHAILTHYARLGNMLLEYRPRHRRTYQEGASLHVESWWSLCSLYLSQVGTAGKKSPNGLSSRDTRRLSMYLALFGNAYLDVENDVRINNKGLILPKLLPTPTL